ncbi:unnamed protein product [Didymodactylos carnosus]|uniref:Uncharacterized protein n=1 Tax=Didymodactylos carnosus TaxID=1234261 RepID=A0A814E8D6_9BILA|nr:unnamed protein product [Didymodactylos carnosus]CAF0967434.1 unnamed protein product [Didymodactylos carnosus]CAF3618230.1 unnamed protein product [Didymodactylos carnosus]CAF3740823.1 unnamed protein product [Didymodactylos carnosus]
MALSYLIGKCQCIDENCLEQQYAICPHCHLWLCLKHTCNHQKLVKIYAHELSDQTDQLVKVFDTLTVDQIYTDCQQKLDLWKNQMITIINTKYQESSKQLFDFNMQLLLEFNKFKQDSLNELQNEIAIPLCDMLTKQNQIHPSILDDINIKLTKIQTAIDKIKQLLFIQIDCGNAQLNGDIQILKDSLSDYVVRMPTFDIEQLNQQPTKKFALKSNYIAAAASDQFILAYDHPSLVLFDCEKELNRVKLNNNEAEVYDLCWSNTMCAFLILTLRSLYVYDPLSSGLKQIEQIKLTDAENIWSITTYQNDLFICYLSGECIIECRSLPSWQKLRRWKKNDICDKDDVYIHCIRANEVFIGMTIKQVNKTWKFGIFDHQMSKIRQIQIDQQIDHINTCMLTPICSQKWLTVNSSLRKISFIDEDNNQIKQINKNVNNGFYFGDQLFVLRTTDGLEFYEL